MSKKIDYSFNVDGLHHSANYYRSEVPMYTEAMPVATTTGIEGLTYTDTTALSNKDYFVRFGAVKNTIEKISSEIIVSTFEPVPWSNVVTLLNFENGLVDATGKRTWTSTDANVAKVIDTSLLWGSKALSIVGTALGKCIYTGDSADFWFGSGNFGIEASIHLLSKDNFHAILSQRNDFQSNESFSFYYFNNALVFEYSENGNVATVLSAPFPLNVNQKYSIQAVRNGVSLKIAVDGVVLIDHNIGTKSLFNSTARVVVGQLNATLSGGYFNGYIDEIRVTKGYAPPIKAKLYTFLTS